MEDPTQQLPLLVICGPTASGKTSLAVALARWFELEIISADSRQIYRGMDVGTAKPSSEEQALVPHHLLDVVDPDEDFTAADFLRRARAATASIAGRGRLPAAVGGTGLYLRALLEGLVDVPGADPELRRQLHRLETMEGEGALHRRLQRVDPELAARIHPRNRVRVVRALEVYQQTGTPFSELQRRHGFGDQCFSALKIGLALEREENNRRIDQRVEEMAAAGLLSEVERLLAAGYDPALKALQTIGYQECIEHLAGTRSWEETVVLIQRNTRRYAKRQMTWFRRDPEIIWVDSLRESDRIPKLIDNFYATLKERTWPRPHSTFKTSF